MKRKERLSRKELKAKVTRKRIKTKLIQKPRQLIAQSIRIRKGRHTTKATSIIFRLDE